MMAAIVVCISYLHCEYIRDILIKGGVDVEGQERLARALHVTDAFYVAHSQRYPRFNV